MRTEGLSSKVFQCDHIKSSFEHNERLRQNVATVWEETGSKKVFENRWIQSATYGDCKVEFYTAKSYIRQKVDGKFLQVIGSCHQQHHREVVDRLVPYVEQGLSKEELNKQRDEIMVSLVEDVD